VQARSGSREEHADIADEALAGCRGQELDVAHREPGPDNPVYRTHAEAMTEVLRRILTGIEQVRDQRLVAALGKSPDDSKASRRALQSSHEGLDYIAASAERCSVSRRVGVLGLLPDTQSSYGQLADFEFANLKRALEGSGAELSAALADPQLRSKLSYAAIVLQSLRDLFERHVAVCLASPPFQLARRRLDDCSSAEAFLAGTGAYACSGLAPRAGRGLARQADLGPRAGDAR